MGKLKRLLFAYKHDLGREFVIVEMGEMPQAIRFLYYEDAVARAQKLANERPQYGIPHIMTPVYPIAQPAMKSAQTKSDEGKT